MADEFPEGSVYADLLVARAGIERLVALHKPGETIRGWSGSGDDAEPDDTITCEACQAMLDACVPAGRGRAVEAWPCATLWRLMDNGQDEALTHLVYTIAAHPRYPCACDRCAPRYSTEEAPF